MKTTIGILVSVIVMQFLLVIVIGHFAPTLVTANPISGAQPGVSVWSVLSFSGGGL